MKSKITKASRNKVSKAKVRVKSLSADAEYLINEHDSYSFESNEAAASWFESLPIETLEESLNIDYGRPTGKFSLKDMSNKFSLRRAYGKKSEELEMAVRDLNIANIDYIMSKVESVRNNLND